MALLRSGIISLLFAVAFVPLVVADGLFFPFVTGKALVFRALIDVAFVLWCALYIRGGVRAYVSKGVLLIGAFVGVVGIANLFGVHPWYSMVSNFERMEGFVLLVHAALFFYIAATVFSKKEWRAWWYMLVGVGVVASCIALVQALSGIARPGSVFGNPIYLAGFELFCIGVAAFLYAGVTTFRARVLLAMPILLSLATIYVSGTRGAVIGLIGAVATSMLVIAVSHPRGRFWAIGGVLALVLSVGGGWLLLQQYTFTPGTPLARIANISLNDTTVQSRLLLAEMAYKGLQERPVFGYGQEGFTAVFATHYTEKLFAYEPWYDRVHNVFIDWFVMAGITGGVLFMAWVGSFVWYTARYWRGYERAILIGLVVGYALYLATVFHDVTSYILLFALFAFLSQKRGTDIDVQKESKQRVVPAVPAAFVMGVLCMLVVNAPTLYTAGNILTGLVQVQYVALAAEQKNTEAVLALSARARDTFEGVGATGARELHEQRAIAAIKIAQMEMVPIAEKSNWYTAAVEGIAQNIAVFPDDPRQFVLLGDVHALFGNTEAALQAYSLAQERSPNKQSIMVARARMLANSGKLEESIALIDKVLATNFEGVSVREELQRMRAKLVAIEEVL